MLLNGSVTPMNETNDDRELYVLCVDQYVFLPEGAIIKEEECHEYVYRRKLLSLLKHPPLNTMIF